MIQRLFIKFKLHFKNISYFLFVDLFNKLATFFTLPIIFNTLTENNFGYYTFSILITLGLTVIGPFGHDTTFTRNLYDENFNIKINIKQNLFPGIIKYLFIGILLILLIYLFFKLNIITLTICYFLGLLQIIQVFLRSIFIVYKNAFYFFVFYITQTLIFLLAFTGLYKFYTISVNNLLIINLISVLLSLILGVKLIIKMQVFNKEHLNVIINSHKVEKAFRLKNYYLSIANFININSDRFIVEKYASINTFSFYSLSNSMVGPLKTLSSAVLKTLQPYIFDNLFLKNNKKIRQIEIFLVVTFALFCTSFYGLIYFYVKLFINKSKNEVIFYIPFFLFIAFFEFCYMLRFNVLLFHKQMKLINISEWLLLIIQIMISLYIFKYNSINVFLYLMVTLSLLRYLILLLITETILRSIKINL